MKKTIYGLLAVIAISVSACNDNYDEVYEPTKTTKTLELTSTSPAFNAESDKLELNAGSSTSGVEVKSNTRWKVEVLDCDGGWCDVTAFSGSGDGEFSITVRENLGETRNCIVRVSKIDAEGNVIDDTNETNRSQDIIVVQNGSDVRLSPSSVEPFASLDARTQEFDITSDVDWTLDISYESASTPQFIEVTPIEGMTEESPGVFKGSSSAKFRISLLNNGSNADRKGYLTLSSEIGKYAVEITQLKSDYTIYVTPGEVSTVAATGGTLTFGVLSLSNWKVTSDAEAQGWISLDPGEGAGSLTTPVSVTATVAPNASGLSRSAVISFVPSDANYQPYTVNVMQNGFDITFSASPSDGTLGVVATEGGYKEFTLDSRFDWEISTPDWISASRSNGNASEDSQSLSVSIGANNSGASRTGTITIRPLPTEAAPGVTIFPEETGVDPIQFGVTQFGGREPALSIPWLRDDYTQTSATVEFNFYSPFYPVSAAGIEWRRADDNSGDWNDERVSFDTEQTDYTVSVTLNNLDPATSYVARGYVVYSGTVKYSNISFPFTTAGARPGPDDNPTPGL